MNRQRWAFVAAAVGLIAAIPVSVVLDQPVQAATASVSCSASTGSGAAPSPVLQSYTAINPQRLVDTRNNIGGVGTALGRGCTLRMNVSADVPANAAAVSLSLTAVSNERDFFTVFPCASGQPSTSNLNSRAGVPTPNLVVAIPDANREICIFSHGASHLIVDLAGWWSDGPDRFASIPPARAYDSRQPGGTRLAPFQVREVPIPASIIPANSTAAVVNLTAARSTAAGYLVAFPCGQEVPPSSNLNFAAGEDRAVAAIVGLGSGSTLCVLSDVATDVIVDVNGYYAPVPVFSPTAQLQPLPGTRVVDSRNGIGGPQAPFQAGETRQLDPVALLAAAPEAASVLLNFVATRPQGAGFLTVFPCNSTRPEVSSLNYTSNTEATNLVAVELAADRTICVYASQPTDVIIDVFGVMAAPAGSLAERITLSSRTWPDYNPAAADFAVACGSGTTSLDITLDLLPNVTATLDGQAVTSGTVNRPVATDQLLNLTLRRGSQITTQLFRCLPADFPTLSVQRPGNPAPGWYLTTFGMAGSPLPGYQVIFDHFGAPIWYKRTTEPVFDFKKLSNGTLVATPALGQAFGSQPTRGYWNTRLDGSFIGQLYTTDPTNLPTDQHDLVELPNGGRTMLSYPLLAPRDLTALNGTLAGQCAPLNPATCPFVANDRIVDGVIEEINPDGTRAWTWRATDHIPDTASTFPNRFTVPAYGTPGVVDLHHLNGLDLVKDGTGDYLVTARHLDSAFRIDRATGAIDWTVGGRPFAGGNHLTIVGDPSGGPKRPHDARLNGNVLTMMDNRTGVNQPSRAVAYRIDEVARTATLLWEIPQATGQTGGTLGSVRVGADGSVLVGWGAPVQPMFTEYDANRNLIMSITQAPFGYSYRIVKYATSEFDVNQLRAAAGGAPVGPP
jgi:hypothetical protein